jgi:hypothetical protein
MSENETPAKPAARPSTVRPTTHPTSILTNPKDQAPRPGFRSPPNQGTKAQKTKKK